MAYTRVNWQDLPSTSTPRNATNLNKMDSAIKEHDDKLLGNTTMGDIVVDSIRTKNLLNLKNCIFEHCLLNNDMSMTSNISNFYFSSIKFTYLNDFILNNKGKSITFSIGEAISNKKVTIVIYGTRSGVSDIQEFDSSVGARYISGTIANDFTSITQIELRFNRSSTPFTDTTTIVSDLMLEINTTTPTEYAPYQDLNIDYGKYACIKIPSSQTISLTAWQYQDVPFTNSPIFSTNSSLFEATSTGIKCKFTGTLLIFTMLSISDVGEIDVKIGNKTYVSTGSRQNYCMSFINVNKNDIVPLSFTYGATLSLTIYDASILVLKL